MHRDSPTPEAQRRGGARYSRILVDPAHAATLMQSPVNTAAATTVGPPPARQQHHTPQPVRRTIFSRLFRMKTGRSLRTTDGEMADDEVSESGRPSPASHQSTPTSRVPCAEVGPTVQTTSERIHVPVYALAASTATSVDSVESDTRILAEGFLTKLSSHKYWHVKATYFVLEEENVGLGSAMRSQVRLKQYRKKPSDGDGAMIEVRLSENDVVVDISDRYIKYGIELLHCIPRIDSKEAEQRDEPHSLRVSVEDITTHRMWMRLLGAAIARLADQSKRHYPITPADVDFVRTKTSVFEPEAVSAIITTAIPQRAKVMPMRSNGDSEDEDERDCDCPSENQAHQQESEMRDPEEPELRSEDENGHVACVDAPPESRLSILSNVFSEEWSSPRSEGSNNNSFRGDESEYGSEDNNNEHRSSNQFEDEEDTEHAAFARRLSECTSPTELDQIVFAATSMHAASPSGTNSVASTPSPYRRSDGSFNHFEEKTEEAEDEDAVVAGVASAMTAASLDTADRVGTPPSPKTPPTSSDRSRYLQQQFHQASNTRFSGVIRPQVHTFTSNGQVFTLDVRYGLLKSIGNGAYGAVIAAKDSLADMSVAIKKITNIFDDLVDAKRILREVRLLRHFHHKNITQLLDLAPPATKKTFEDMYIITELMETDLHQVIYSMQPMSDDHVKYFLYQMLCALYHIHSAGVLHRDMKPSNILLNSNCDLKICDFGLARGGMDPELDATRVANSQPHELTEYVVTRWYRAPEIMLNCLHYTAAIDVWAVGCIFAEMLLREPLFPGNDYIHQLKLIIKFLGTPKQEDVAFVKNVKALRFLTKLSISKPRKWREVFTNEEINPLALDLLAQMLIFNPEKRISVEKALQHPYLSTFYDPEDITRAPPFDFGFDLPDDKLSKDSLVDLLCEDIACFHPAYMQHLKQSTAPPPVLPRPAVLTSNSGPSRYFGMTASAS